MIERVHGHFKVRTISFVDNFPRDAHFTPRRLRPPKLDPSPLAIAV